MYECNHVKLAATVLKPLQTKPDPVVQPLVPYNRKCQPTICPLTIQPCPQTLRLMLSQCHLNQTGPRCILITHFRESNSPATNTAPQVPNQLSAMIASIVEANLVNLNSSSTSGPAILPEIEPAQASPTQPTLTGATNLVSVHKPSFPMNCPC